MHAAAAPALFVLGMLVALAGTFMGGEHHGGHQLLLAGPAAAGGALAFRAETGREWAAALVATLCGTLVGAALIGLGGH